jgi:hypothetical protein
VGDKMNLVLVFCIVIILVGLVLFLIFSKKRTNHVKNEKLEELDKNPKHSRNSQISSLKIHKKIVEMEVSLLQKDCKKLFDNFKSLAYTKKNKQDLALVEWNNWEIFLLMGLIKMDKDMFISNPHEVLHSSIAQLSKSEVVSHMNVIFDKYNKLDKDLTSDVLRSQIKWSPIEVSTIFYYLSIYKNS